jgi:hypothetical protein
MPVRTIVRSVFACFLILLISSTRAQQNPEQEILRTTRGWLKSASQGDRAGLNAIMDARFIAVTPGGDILTKERLVPDDPTPVQQLPPFDLENPIVRLYGDTAVLMTRLSTAGVSQTMNATFVYSKRDNSWRLVAVHISPP